MVGREKKTVNWGGSSLFPQSWFFWLYSLLMALFWKVGKTDQCVHLEKVGHNDSWSEYLSNVLEPY